MKPRVTTRRSLWGAALLAASLVLPTLFVTGSVALADTGVAHGGLPGEHHLVDSATDPGADCRYDAVTGDLWRVRLAPPVMFARDTTPAVDRQWVAAQARLQQLQTAVDVPPVWKTVRRARLGPAVATDRTSPFAKATIFEGITPATYRVRWMMTWFGGDQSTMTTGWARHEVDYHGRRLGLHLPIRVRQDSCGPSLAGRESILVRNGPRTTPRIALTFDFGGRIGESVEIARWLVEHDVPATIFPTGTSASGSAAGRTIMALAAVNPDALLVGNHSWDHPSCPVLTDEEIAEQLAMAEDAIGDLTGTTTKPMFRPPYGAYDKRVQGAVGKAGWALTVTWDVVTTDYIPPWEGGPTPAELVEQVLSRAQPGSIVIMHLGGYPTLAALPDIVEGLDAMGLEPVTVQKLMGW